MVLEYSSPLRSIGSWKNRVNGTPLFQPKKGGMPPTYIASIGIKGERRSKGKQVNLCDHIYKSKSLGNWFIWSIKLCVKTLSKISPMTLEKKLLGLGCFILSFPNMLNPVILKDYSQFKTAASLPSTGYKLTLRSVHWMLQCAKTQQLHTFSIGLI